MVVLGWHRVGRQREGADQTSNGGAGRGCYQGTRALMVHNGGTSQLWWSEFGR